MPNFLLKKIGVQLLRCVLCLYQQKDRQMKKILFFSTNPDIPGQLVSEQVNSLYAFQYIDNLKAAVQLVCKEHIDLCIVEKNADGISLIKTLKLINVSLPTVLICNSNQIEDKLSAFELGCTEYMFEPLIPKELTFRIESALKSHLGTQPAPSVTINELGSISIGSSVIDFQNRVFKTPTKSLVISRKEAELLMVLCLNKNKLVTREYILNEIWKSSDYFASKSMDVYLTKVRKIIREDASIVLQNIHGSGYLIKELVPQEN